MKGKKEDKQTRAGGSIEERFIAQKQRDGAEYLHYASRHVRRSEREKKRRRLAPVGMTHTVNCGAVETARNKPKTEKENAAPSKDGHRDIPKILDGESCKDA